MSGLIYGLAYSIYMKSDVYISYAKLHVPLFWNHEGDIFFISSLYSFLYLSASILCASSLLWRRCYAVEVKFLAFLIYK